LGGIALLNAPAATENKSDDKKSSFYEELERALVKFPKHHMNIFLEHLNAEINRKLSLKQQFRKNI
jgi:phage portal protein BeeE